MEIIESGRISMSARACAHVLELVLDHVLEREAIKTKDKQYATQRSVA